MSDDDALIEAMAQAIWSMIDTTKWDDVPKWMQMDKLNEAKAALAVARPIIEREMRERCAEIAEISKDGLAPDSDYGYCYGYGNACRDIAAAIRSDGDE